MRYGIRATFLACNHYRLFFVFLLGVGILLCACDSQHQNPQIPGTWYVRARNLNVFDSTIDSYGNVWLGEARGLWKLNSNGNLSYVEDEVGTRSTVLNLAFDSEGNLWIHKDANIVGVFDGLLWQEIDVASKLDSSKIQAMFIDSNNNKWFASDQVIARLRGSEWEIIRLPPEIVEREESLESLFVDPETGTIWVGTEKGGVWSRTSEATWLEHEMMPGLPVGEVRSFYLDSSGQLWVGTEYGLFSQEADKWNFHGSPWNEQRYMDAIVVDTEGQVWVGGRGGIGMLSADKEHWTFFEEQARELTPGWVTAIEMDRKGTLWFSGVGGVSQFIPFSLKKGTSSAAIFPRPLVLVT